MTALRVFLLRLSELVVGRRRARRLDAEIEAHLALLADEHVRRGASRTAALEAARRDFGGAEAMRAAHRDQRGLPLVDDLAQDVRFAARRLARDRWLTLLATGALGLGLAANQTFLTIVDAICLRGLPIERPDRVAVVGSKDPQGNAGPLSIAELDELRRSTRSFEALAGFSQAAMTVAEGTTAPDRVDGAYVSSGTFALLREKPALGRELEDADDRPGAMAVAMLSHRLWSSRYARDAGVIGRTIRVDDRPATVVGIMPPGFWFPSNADIWQPLAALPALADGRDRRLLTIIGRLTDSVALGGAAAELDALASRLAIERPQANRGMSLTARPINEQFNGRATDTVWVAFMTAGALVLLIACANVANLLLMRASARGREMAVRASLGASRWRLVRQLLVESTLLAAMAAAMAALFSIGALRVLTRLIPADTLPYWMRFSMDVRMFAALACVSIGSVFLFGLVPAVHLARSSVHDALKEGGRAGASGPRSRRWTAAFLTAELALSFVLLANVAFNVSQMASAQRAELAIDPAPLLTLWLTLPAQTHRTAAERLRFYDALEERLEALPNVASATIATALPMGGAVPQRLVIEGRPALADAPPEIVQTLAIGPRYFETLGLPVRRGRGFDVRDGAPSTSSAIVNERFAQRYLGSTDPVGRRIRLAPDASPGEPTPWLKVVGVSPTIRQRAVANADAMVYQPYRVLAPPTVAVIVRTRAETAAVVSKLREEVRRLDPGVPVYRIRSFEQARREAGWNGRMASQLLNGIAGSSLLLALVGLYAVTTHAVAQRTQEIGVRVALGARASQVRWLVLRRAGFQVGLGLGVGVLCTIGWQRAFAADVPIGNQWVLGVVVVLLAVVALAACLLPASRAARVDPVIALRGE